MQKLGVKRTTQKCWRASGATGTERILGGTEQADGGIRAAKAGWTNMVGVGMAVQGRRLAVRTLGRILPLEHCLLSELKDVRHSLRLRL